MESFLNDIYDISNPKTVNINNVFQVKKDSAGIGYYQELHGEADYKQNYKKDNECSSAQRKRIIINIFKHLNQIEKQKLKVEKRFALAKFRRFVIPEYQYYCMYQYLSAEDIKIAKDTYKK